MDLAVVHLCTDKLGVTTGEQDRLRNIKFPAQGNKASKPLAVKPVGVVVAGETASLTGESVGGIHSGPTFVCG